MKYVATYRFLSDDADMEASFHVEVEAGDEDTAAVQAHDKLCWQMAQWCSSSTSVAFDFTGIRPSDPVEAMELAVHEAEIAAYKEFDPPWIAG